MFNLLFVLASLAAPAPTETTEQLTCPDCNILLAACPDCNAISCPQCRLLPVTNLDEIADNLATVVLEQISESQQ